MQLPIERFQMLDGLCQLPGANPADWETSPNSFANGDKYSRQLATEYIHSERRKARQLCESCPVLAACARYALNVVPIVRKNYWAGVHVAGVPFPPFASKTRWLTQQGYMALVPISLGLPLTYAYRFADAFTEAVPDEALNAALALEKSRLSELPARELEQELGAMPDGVGVGA